MFPVDFSNRMEAQYPGVLSMMQRSKNPLMCMMQRNIPISEFSGMIALMHWRNEKVIYNFEPRVASEIMEQTDTPDRIFPLSCIRQLPYPCIAVKVSPVSIIDPATQNSLEEYTGNAFLWLDDDCLYSTWQAEGDEDRYLISKVDISDNLALDDILDSLMKENLKQFSDQEISEIKQLLGIKRFNELRIFGHDGDPLKQRFGNRIQEIYRAIRIASVQDVLTQRALHIILYLGCENADIESAEEKLKNSAWSTIVGGVPRYIKRPERRQAMKEVKDCHIMDVGYRIAGHYTRSFSSSVDKNQTGNGSGRTQGYSKRRAHFHHFWIGPKNGALADDIMNPKAGERGLRLRWIEATEIHPELRDENATIVNVGKL